MTTLDSRLSNLSAEKRKLLERRLVEKRLAASQADLIPRRNHTGPCPVSFAQELLWLVDRISPGTNAAYNVPRAVRVSGPLNLGAMEKALNQILERHEVLRTTIRAVDGVPTQTIAPHSSVRIEVEDLSDRPEAEREAEVKRLLVHEARFPFDLSRDLMLRTRLYKMGEQDHLLLLISHHIASDGWSRGLLFRELMELYQASIENRPARLPELPIQYTDFAVWQREALQGESYHKHLEYWKRQLTGAPNLLHLPTDRPRPPQQSYRGARQTMIFPGSLLQSLKALGRAEGATLFMVLLAAFKVLLYRYTRETDLVVGTPIAGRGRMELEPLIGYFSNTLVLRTDVSGNPTFRQLLQRVRDVSLDAYGHQDVPFEKLVVELQPERDLSHTPLFQVMFSVGVAPTSDLQVPGLILTPLRTDRGSAKFDLTLGLTEGPEALTGSFEYNTDIFDASTIYRMVGHFENVLQSIVSDADRAIDTISLLHRRELNELVFERNQAMRKFPLEGTLHGLVELRAELTPDAIAVAFQNQKLSYRQLNEHANRVANYLRRHGIKANSPVGIYLERSLELPVALLGVLKAGAVCVPLDPAYPKDRIALMLSDSQQQMVITQQSLLSLLPEARPEVMMIDLTRLDRESAENGTWKVSGEDHAYLIYTSGSTGAPRGVVLGHRGLVNHSLAAIELYGLTPTDRVLQFSSISFDIAIEEIFPTLISGGTVVFRSDETPISGTRFLEWLNENAITVLDLPTAFWHQWVSELASPGVQVPRQLRLVIVGGEKASASTYRTFRRVVGNHLRWINTYGPTEASVIVTAFEPTAQFLEPSACQELPIGVPIANTAIYIMDPSLSPVPAGVIGELLIGGEGVAKGYWNRPELTSQKFVSITLPDGSVTTAYRTGDLARWRSDGLIEFIGRTDFQVKIRGFRVELGEIESALAQHPDVQEALVVAAQSASGEKRLVAYVVSAVPQATLSLRKFLQEKLPEYMVPAAFIALKKFPLTANGKVDRSALPSDQEAASSSGQSYAPPRDPLEIQLTKIWESVLGLPRVGVKDNFFDLGGHSLLAIRIIDHIEKECGRTLPLATLFGAPTIELLADAILTGQGRDSDSVLVRVQAGGSHTPFFFFHGDLSGGGLYCRALARTLGEERPFYALQPLGSDGKEVPATMEEMIQEYVGKIRHIQPAGPYILGGFCNGGLVAFEVAQQLRNAGNAVDMLLLVDTWPNNLGYRFVKFAVFLGASSLGLDREMQAAAFIRVRAFMVRTRKALRLKLLGAYLRRKFNYLQANARAFSLGVDPVSEADPKLWFARNRTFGPDMYRRIENSDRYRRALKAYIPSPYLGQVASFCPSEGIGKHRQRFQRIWKKLAPNAEVIFVTGDHLSCVTDHVATLGEMFRKRLARCDGDQNSATTPQSDLAKIAAV